MTDNINQTFAAVSLLVHVLDVLLISVIFFVSMDF